MTNKESLDVLATLDKYILKDGYDLVLDFEKSHGCYFHDSKSNKDFLDFFSFFASLPLGYNHPKMQDTAFKNRLLNASMIKPSNSDIYTSEYADFVETFARIAGDGYPHYFFISGGALAVENALKAAFDWKVRKNMAQGKGEKGSQIIHFKQSFHGRSGYTLSLTNTDPKKTMYFPKFDWPRIDSPACIFPMNEENTATVIKKEQVALQQIEDAIQQNPDDIAALIIEPIQSEGGDNHFRKEFLQALKDICDNNEILLIFDEVQTGIGLTGKMWCYQHYDIRPDIVCFGKKTQTCGIMAGPRLNEVDSVFHVSSRINSTFGGNLVDMVRCQRYLEIIDEEQIINQVNEIGQVLLSGLNSLSEQFEFIDNVRGRGFQLAFDCDSPERRQQIIQQAYQNQMIVLSCGERSIRLRPSLNLRKEEAELALNIFEKSFKALT